MMISIKNGKDLENFFNDKIAELIEDKAKQYLFEVGKIIDPETGKRLEPKIISADINNGIQIKYNASESGKKLAHEVLKRISNK